MTNLKMIQETNDDPQLAVLNIINTRWLSLSNVVSNLYQILDSVIDALNSDRMNANDQKDSDRAAKVLELLDSKFKLSTMYMADLTYILSILCKTFQKDNISLSEVKYSLDIAIASITTQFIGIDNQPPTYGINVQKYLQENTFYNNHLPDEFTYFAKALVCSLQARFPHNDLYYSMRIFDPKELPSCESELSSYGIEEIETLYEYFGNKKNKSDGTTVGPLINSLEWQKEWGMVKHVMKTFKKYNMIEGWHHIWNTWPQFVNQFPNINILINITLLIPLSNANVERVFSQHKLTKTRLRNRMNVESLESHLMILLNAPDNIEDFNWDKAFNQWEIEQVRRVNQN